MNVLFSFFFKVISILWSERVNHQFFEFPIPIKTGLGKRNCVRISRTGSVAAVAVRSTALNASVLPAI